MSRTAVVILNYNGEKLLQKFLPIVLEFSPEAQIFVADNNSSDHSLEIVQRIYPAVKVIPLDKNYGFCGGYNRALSQIEADYFVLLNSDIEVTANWLTPLIQLLDRNATVAAVQPKVLSYEKKSRFEHAGAGGGFIDALGYPFCRGRIFDYVEEDRGQYNDEREVFWATGACLMIRSDSFRKFGGFDEDLFAHMEEIDLCWKLQRSGYKIFYCGKSTIYHIGAGTLAYRNPQKTFLNFRNGLALIVKHLSPVELVYKLPLRLLLDWLASLQFLINGEPKNFLAVLRAHYQFALRLPGILAKRKVIRQAYPAYEKTMIHGGSIVFDYYIRSKKIIAYPDTSAVNFSTNTKSQNI